MTPPTDQKDEARYLAFRTLEDAIVIADMDLTDDEKLTLIHKFSMVILSAKLEGAEAVLEAVEKAWEDDIGDQAITMRQAAQSVVDGLKGGV